MQRTIEATFLLNGMQSFDEWLEINYDELVCLFAENGADREIDFDFEEESYDIYVQSVKVLCQSLRK